MQFYHEAHQLGLRVTPLFPITVLLLSLKEEQNDMKRLEEKAGEEQMSEKCFTWADGVDILKFLEDARCVEEVVKERVISHFSFFSSPKVDFNFFSEKQEKLTDLQSIHSDLSSWLTVYWLDCECMIQI